MASSSLVIDEFIQSVVYDHAIATGLKSCVSDQQIVDYAVSQGFLFPLSEWEQYVSSDAASLSVLNWKRFELCLLSIGHGRLEKLCNGVPC